MWRWEKRFYEKTIEEAELGVRGYNSLGLYELLKAIAPKTDLGTFAVDPTKLHAMVRRALATVFSGRLPLSSVFRDMRLREEGFRDKRFSDKRLRDLGIRDLGIRELGIRDLWI